MMINANILKSLLPTLLASLLLPSAHGQGADHPLIDRFPDSQISDLEFEPDSNYRLILGSLARTRGVVVPGESERLRGDVTKIIYEISEEFNGEDVYDFFQEQIRDKGYDVLYSCAGRDCGSSVYWANDIFQNRVLYGPERNQYYIAMRTPASMGDPAHMVLYIITRGNRQLLAYLEVIQEAGTAPPVELLSTQILDEVSEQGSAILPGITFINDRQLTDNAELDALARELNSNTGMNFYLVAHLGGDQDLEQLINRSMIRAQTVRQGLINLGVDGNRLLARGVGPLAPSCIGENCSERVELVLRPVSE
ncbi:MAG: DUF4892 domain-containing protein [Proteobacteria bacterium]|nr:DUF4892 domain-containing protein [Pseudomonadota bacterium]MDA0927487.1 DUF4892 domain-containing protein [Pseudomonadota bacterium]